jgi:DNA-binding CsgD family transcriptional regulator
MMKIDDYRRVMTVLEEVERATSLSGLRRATLDAVAAHLGWDHAAFLTGATDSGKVEGVALGFPQRRLDALLARMSREHAVRQLLSATPVDLRAVMTREDLWGLLTEEGRSVGDEYLAAQGFRSLMGVWLDPPGTTKGLLVVLDAGRSLNGVDRDRLATLAPHLSNLIALQMPRDASMRSTESLTPREAETVDLVAAGFNNRTIARRLSVTESTVKKHVSAALTKLDVNSRTQLALAWLGSEGGNGHRNGSKKGRRVAIR